MRDERPVFQAYCGTSPPRFVNRIELECAKILDYYGVRWDYEPHTFVLERDDQGRVVSAFTPDFYLPDQNLFIEVKVKLFYRRDIERLAQRYHIRLAS